MAAKQRCLVIYAGDVDGHAISCPICVIVCPHHHAPAPWILANTAPRGFSVRATSFLARHDNTAHIARQVWHLLVSLLIAK